MTIGQEIVEDLWDKLASPDYRRLNAEDEVLPYDDLERAYHGPHSPCLH
jgi:hypothetical protein